MNLVIIRHGIAESPEAFAATGKDDSKRPLTREGLRRMKAVTKGIAHLVPDIDTIATSPFRRAVQTAEAVASACGAPKPKRVDALLPDGDRADVLSWLEEQGEAETIAIVGHEPSLGLLASWLLASPLSHFLEFKKSGACLISWSSRPASGTGWLRWALGPGPLRRLGQS